MKRKGDYSDISRQRDKDLYDAFRDVVATIDFVEMSEVVRLIEERGAKRFYVGEDRMVDVMRAMDKGASIACMSPTRFRMYTELRRRYVSMRESAPDMSDYDIAWEVLRQPAPSYYSTRKSLEKTLSRIRKQRRDEGKKR